MEDKVFDFEQEPNYCLEIEEDCNKLISMCNNILRDHEKTKETLIK